MAIHFFTEACSHKWKNKIALKKWLLASIKTEGYILKEINYILCSDEYLHKMNVDFLQHDTLTDIITFDQSEKAGTIQADIFISIERVAENALTYQVALEKELERIMIHGTLHLMGYKDKTKKDKVAMTHKEDYYLARKLDDGK